MVNMTFTPPENLSTFQQQLFYIDSLTDIGSGGNLGILFLILICGVLYLMMKAFSNEKAMGTSFFATMFIAVGLRALGFINTQVLTFSIILGAFGAWLIFKQAAPFEG